MHQPYKTIAGSVAKLEKTSNYLFHHFNVRLTS